MTIDATYSPEDDKLRLYASQRLDPETYARVKAAGFGSALDAGKPIQRNKLKTRPMGSSEAAA